MAAAGGQGQGRWPAAVVAVLAVAVAVGIACRVHGAAAYPLWLDEAYSAFAADHSFAWIWRMVPQYETHPPLYYSLVRAWAGLTGQSLLARRLLGLLCGVVTIGVAAMVAARIGRAARFGLRARWWMIAAAATLVALQPLLVAMSREVRPYPVMILVYGLSLLPLIRLFEDARAGRALSMQAIAGFFVCEALMLWLHSLGPLYGLTMTLALVIAVLRPGLGRRDWTLLLAGQALVGLLYLPAFLIMIHQARTWVKSGWVVFDWSAVPVTVAQIWLDWNIWACLLGLALVVTGIVVVRRRADGWRIAAVLLLMTLLPVLLSILLSATVSPVFLARTLAPTAIPALLLASLALGWAGRLLWGIVVGTALVAGSMVAIDHEQALRGPPQDWYGAIDWLQPRMAPGDIVWAYPNEGALPLAYALRDKRTSLPWLQVPSPVPAVNALGFHSTGGMGTVSLYPTQIDALMRTEAARRPPTIWLLRLSGELYDKDDAMLQALERERAVVGRFQSRQIDFIGLRRKDLPPVAAPQQAQP